MKLTIATRGSALALCQTEWVIQRLREQHGAAIEIETLTVRTQGDRVQHVPLSQIGGKGIFVKEIEDTLMSGAADFAVHSLKDMPADQPPGLCLTAIPIREDARDALVLPGSDKVERGLDIAGHETRNTQHEARPNARTPEPLAALPHGAAVGTTSRRRGALLLHERPDLQIQMLRGNLDTRLHKLDAGQHDAIVLAAAGLRRLGFAARISELLPIEHFVPCAGQGALAIEARAEDSRVRALLEALDHSPTRECVTAERAVMRRLVANCHTPLGAHARLEDGRLVLHGMLASPDGADMLRVSTHAKAGDPEAAGHRLADLLIDAGGDRVLASLLSDEANR